MKTSIKFINHASVIVSADGISILSDPWYQGPAFNKVGTYYMKLKMKRLLVILTTLRIWISFEHPDHFSIPFLKFSDKIKSRSIKILTKD